MKQVCDNCHEGQRSFCRTFASLNHSKQNFMWYQYPAAFFSGAFLGNFVPHFVHGTSGNKFPTPFSNPRGIGLSSSTTNVLWALFNLVAGYLLFTISMIDRGHPDSLLVFLAGIAAISLYASVRFQKKHKE